MALQNSKSALALIAFLASTVGAAADADFDRCAKARGEEAIEACTDIIKLKQYSGRELARTYLRRGLATAEQATRGERLKITRKQSMSILHMLTHTTTDALSTIGRKATILRLRIASAQFN